MSLSSMDRTVVSQYHMHMSTSPNTAKSRAHAQEIRLSAPEHSEQFHSVFSISSSESVTRELKNGTLGRITGLTRLHMQSDSAIFELSTQPSILVSTYSTFPLPISLAAGVATDSLLNFSFACTRQSELKPTQGPLLVLTIELRQHTPDVIFHRDFTLPSTLKSNITSNSL